MKGYNPDFYRTTYEYESNPIKNFVLIKKKNMINIRQVMKDFQILLLLSYVKREAQETIRIIDIDIYSIQVPHVSHHLQIIIILVK